MSSRAARAGEEDLRAADGRVPGRRGLATRQKLLACTADLLDSTSYRDVKVIDIARIAGTSPATFYQYFADVEAAILVLAEQMAQEGGALPRLVHEGSWKGRPGWETALELVDRFLAFWDDHRAVLRVVDLKTVEGDQRFHQPRVRWLSAVTDTLADVFRRFQDDGKHPPGVDPRATAGAMVSMLAHVAAHRYGFEFWGIRTGDLRTSMARTIFWSITGQRPPD